MSFYQEYQDIKNIKFGEPTDEDVLKSLNKNKLTGKDFRILLSETAESHMESLAQKSKVITQKNFGKTIQLYTPIYLSNYCDNACKYCGFRVSNNIRRKKLSLEEVEVEAIKIAETQMKHILVLTGESRKESNIDYIEKCVKILKKYFDSISIEIQALTEEEYARLISVGVDGLTIYQEAYNEQIYDEVHLGGPKKNYKFRLLAPERAAKSKMRTINIGALLGLADWRSEAFVLGMHAKYLQDQYPEIEIGVSLPRIRPEIGGFLPEFVVTDKNIVQIITVMRLFLPRVGITISTRETSEFRDNLLGLGVTKMSAESTTMVGGHTQDDDGDNQFDICDKRSTEEIKEMVKKKGYQPVYKDWMHI